VASVFSQVDPLIAMGGIFFLLVFALGFADHVERVNYARFVASSIRDLREKALRGALRKNDSSLNRRSGDLVSRIVGDAARIKAGLQGFLIHVATNGLMFIGVTVVLIWIHPPLGLIFSAAGILTWGVTAFSASSIFGKALRHRKKEGRLANSIQRACTGESFDKRVASVDGKSTSATVAVSRIQGMTTWCVHGIFGIAVFTSLWAGGSAVSAGSLNPRDLFVFFAYALVMRAPMVQLARQGARTGKITASAYRLTQLLNVFEEAEQEQGSLAFLRDCLRLAEVKVSGAARRRLGPMSAVFCPGERIAIMGRPGSGKSTLLQVLAGRIRPKRGEILWDGLDMRAVAQEVWSQNVAYLPHSPSECWNTSEFKDQIREDNSENWLKLLRTSQSVIKHVGQENENRLAAAELSFGERRLLGVARIIAGNASAWLLDDPASGISEKMAKKIIRAVLESVNQHTLVIVTFSQPLFVEKFDRVIELRRGRIVFDGAPADWLAQTRQAIADPVLDAEKEINS